MTDPLPLQRALLVDDDPVVRAQLAALLQRRGWDASVTADASSAAERLAREPVDVVLLDVHLGDVPGTLLLEEIRRAHPRLPVVILTSDQDRDVAIRALELGAADYLIKPVRPEHLLRVLRSCVVSGAEADTTERSPEGFDSECLEMRALLAQLRRVAPTRASILLQGESGTGKERIARALHQLSERAQGPFVPINCAAIPENLQESVLFGHERGAFTGATSRHVGHFEKAHGGTLFLDEVAELSSSAQAKLLRALQERAFFRVGGAEEIRSDFRVVAASHNDLPALIERGAFRLDLFHRLAVFELEVPPLRVRGPDLIRLATAFFRLESGRPDAALPRDVVDALYRYPWPGNIRELHNAMQRLAVLSAGAGPRFEHLPPRVRAVARPDVDVLAGSARSDTPAPAREAMAEPPPRTVSTPLRDHRDEPSSACVLAVPSLRLADVERVAIERAVERCDGNLSAAARLLGVGRTTLYRKLDAWRETP